MQSSSIWSTLISIRKYFKGYDQVEPKGKSFGPVGRNRAEDCHQICNEYILDSCVYVAYFWSRGSYCERCIFRIMHLFFAKIRSDLFSFPNFLWELVGLTVTSISARVVSIETLRALRVIVCSSELALEDFGACSGSAWAYGCTRTSQIIMEAFLKVLRDL